MRMTETELNHHIRTLKKAFPKRWRENAEIYGYNQRTLSLGLGNAKVVLERNGSGCDYFMKVLIPEEVVDRTEGIRKAKSYKHKNDDTFSYKAIAAYVTDALDQYQVYLDRLKVGETIAEKRIAVLQEMFKTHEHLSALNLTFKADAVWLTETGEVEVEVGSKPSSYPDDKIEPVTSTVTYNGETLCGSVEFEEISLAQLTAMLMIARADQLNILDMLVYADDSLLGPIINELTEKLNKVGA